MRCTEGATVAAPMSSEYAQKAQTAQIVCQRSFHESFQASRQGARLVPSPKVAETGWLAAAEAWFVARSQPGSVTGNPGPRSAGADRLLFRHGVRQVGADRARVMRCRRSLLVGGGCCSCCHRCCQRLLTDRGHSASFMLGSVLNPSGKLTYSRVVGVLAGWHGGRL
jgi:hypothetical protein